MLPPSLSNGIFNFGTEQGSGGGALKEITLSFVFSSLLEAPFHLNQAAALEFVTQTPVISFSTSRKLFVRKILLFVGKKFLAVSAALFSGALSQNNQSLI